MMAIKHFQLLADKKWGLSPNWHGGLYNISVCFVFSCSCAVSDYPNYVAWLAAYSYYGRVVSVDSGQLVSLHFMFFQKLCFFFGREKFMLRHKIVVENLERWKDWGNQFDSALFRAGFSCVSVFSDCSYYSFLNFGVVHGFFELSNICDAHCSVGGNCPDDRFLVIFHFDGVTDGILYILSL